MIGYAVNTIKYFHKFSIFNSFYKFVSLWLTRIFHTASTAESQALRIIILSLLLPAVVSAAPSATGATISAAPTATPQTTGETTDISVDVLNIPADAFNVSPDAVSPDSMAQRAENQTDKMKDYENKTDELVWNGDYCGCTPELSYQIYGFYPFWLSDKVTQPDFSILSRIAYYSLTPDRNGNLPDPPLQWAGKSFKQEAHRYGTKVDLVISYYDWKDKKKRLALEKDYVINKLTDNIVDLVHNYDGDGVTIDFDGIPEELHNRFYNFIYLLHKSLKRRNPDYLLNLIIPYKTAGDSPLNAKYFGELKAYVDLVLVMNGISAHEKSSTVLNQFLSIYSKEKHHKIIPVISLGSDTKFEKKYELIVWKKLGGVGLWNLGIAGGQEFVKEQFKVNAANQDLAKSMLTRFFPGLCDYICPNRIDLRGLLFIVTVIYCIPLFLSVIFCEVRLFIGKYFFLYLAVGGGLILLFEIWFLCSPIGKSHRDEMIVTIFFAALVYLIWRYQTKKRKQNFP